LTAVGAALALVALLAAVRGAFDFMFLCLTLIVDASTAPSRAPSRWPSFCRAGRARSSIWWWISSPMLFVPAYAIAAGGLLPPGLGGPAGIVSS
jgi:hypothetical protein